MRESAYKRGYNKRWQKARLLYLKQNPLCVMCYNQGLATTATVVDHITPHKGDNALFWDTNNWQPLCKQHHDSTKKRMENQNIIIGCDELGLPIDDNHHWNK
jgi:5-methylcytosine-specific restriction endonuclease McrA